MFELENHRSGAASSTAPRPSTRTAFAASDAVDLRRVAADQSRFTERVDVRTATSTVSGPFAVIAADPIDYSI